MGGREREERNMVKKEMGEKFIIMCTDREGNKEKKKA